jgi:hypothetical protein
VGALENQRDEREDSAFAAVVGAHHEHEVLDADDGDERPQNQRQNAIDVGLARYQSILRLEALAQRVEGACPDVAVDDAEREYSQFCETTTGRTSFDVGADLRDLKRLLHAYRSSGGFEPRNFRL